MSKKLIFSLFSLMFQIFMLLAPTPSYAVLADTPSATAEIAAAERARAAREKDEKIRNPDYLAEKFVGSAASWDLTGSKTCWYYAFTARTKHIDAVLKKEGSEGIQQVVNLGVGYDTRAHRFHKTMPHVKFFELDMPVLIARKKKIVAKIFGALPSYVIYVPIDFEKQSLNDALTKAGYNKTKKTLYIWEGVTFYLTKEAVDGTLKFIAEQSATGSSVIFEYLTKSFIDGRTSKTPPSAFAKACMMIIGMNPSEGDGASALFTGEDEPWIYGIDPVTIKEYLKDRGLELLTDIGSDEMTKMYLIDSNGAVAGRPCSFERLAHAVITKKR